MRKLSKTAEKLLAKCKKIEPSFQILGLSNDKGTELLATCTIHRPNGKGHKTYQVSVWESEKADAARILLAAPRAGLVLIFLSPTN